MGKAAAESREYATHAIDEHAQLVGNQDEPMEAKMSDLVTDMMFVAKKEGINFDTLVRRAEGHYEAET